MTYRIHTHDAWGTTTVGTFQSPEEAQQAFSALCQDPWYRQDGGVKGLELVQEPVGQPPRRLAWFPVQQGRCTDCESQQQQTLGDYVV